MATIEQIVIALRMSRAAGSAASALRSYSTAPDRDPVVERLLRGFAANQRSLRVPAAVAAVEAAAAPSVLPAMTETALARAQDAGWLTVHRSRSPR